MDPIQTGKHYDTIVELWSDDHFNMNNGIEQHKKAISYVKSRGKALDVGCGRTGRIMDLLEKEGFQAEGIDVSEKMIKLAQSRNPEYTFYHADICTYQLDQTYDFISAWDSIWHIPLDSQADLVSKLAGALNIDGVMIFTFGGTNEPDSHTDDTMGPLMYYSSLGTNGFIQVLLAAGCTIKHLESDQHTYLVAQKVT